ncbi:hypothetical protein GJ496_007158 [Pomphorhynchus laevis]|nr:hypothetical protein GJ496_007158 [Pomphorhynchus laevis]
MFIVRVNGLLLKNIHRVDVIRCKGYANEHSTSNNDDVTKENDFRVLISPDTRVMRKKKRRSTTYLPRYKSMPIDQDWTNIWPTQSVFKYSAVPLPLRQGLVTCMLENDGIVPGKYANAELMKIPNFLHLTPNHVQKHCEAIKRKFWLSEISLDSNRLIIDLYISNKLKF